MGIGSPSASAIMSTGKMRDGLDGCRGATMRLLILTANTSAQLSILTDSTASVGARIEAIQVIQVIQVIPAIQAIPVSRAFLLYRQVLKTYSNKRITRQSQRARGPESGHAPRMAGRMTGKRDNVSRTACS